VESSETQESSGTLAPLGVSWDNSAEPLVSFSLNRYAVSMRTSLLLIALAVSAFAQETRTSATTGMTIVTSHSPGDAKPNDPNVPDAYAIDAGKFERVLIFRFKYQTDLLAGLERMVKENHVRNGVILAAAGSVTGFQVHQVVNSTFPSKIALVKREHLPADLVSMNGYIMNGRLHPHITLAIPQGALGGHLEPGTKVFTFAIVTVGVLPDDLDLSKLDDKDYR